MPHPDQTPSSDLFFTTGSIITKVGGDFYNTQDFRDQEGIDGPVLTVNSGTRADCAQNISFLNAITSEAQTLAEATGQPTRCQKDNLIALITHAASPHVPGKINFSEHTFPSHCIIWLLDGKDTAQPLRWGSLTERLTPAQLDVFGAVTQQAINSAIQIIAQGKDMTPKEMIATGNLRIYFLSGFTNTQERQQYGLARGSQSSEHAHIQVCYFDPYEIEKSTKIKGVTPEKLIKQLHPITRVGVTECGPAIQKILTQILTQQGHASRSIIEHSHTASREEKALIANSKIIFSLEQPITLQEAYHLQLHIYDVLESIYQKLATMYLNLLTHIGDAYTTQNIQNEIIEKLKQYGLEQDDISSLVSFATKLQPTYTQLRVAYSWAEERNDQVAMHRLQKKILKIEKRQQTLLGGEKTADQNNATTQSSLLEVAQKIQRIFEMPLPLALAYVKLMLDRMRPISELSEITNVMSGRFSSFLEMNFVTSEDGETVVTSMILSPVFASLMGGAETRTQSIIERAEPR